MGGKNIGDLLNAAGITWGWFAGGFNLNIVNPDGSTGCNRQSTSPIVGTQGDYVPHHTPFQYYASTANPTHARPKSVQDHWLFGRSCQSRLRHRRFLCRGSAGNFPAVSFLKAISIQDAHPGNSDPLDEQQFVVKVANFLQSQPEWSTQRWSCSMTIPTAGTIISSARS
jgi:phospholipase C